MFVISGNFGNDTLAMIQWAYENALSNVTVVSIDTGWAAEEWLPHVQRAEAYVKTCGFDVVRLTAVVPFPDLVRDRKAFPSPKFGWCAGFLKGLPLLTWLDNIDPSGEATIMIGKRQAASRANINLPEFLEESPHHGDRKMWYPLYQHSNVLRDQLILRAGFSKLPHRSLECDPCIYDKHLLAHTSPKSIAKTALLEQEVQTTLFPPELFHNAHGIEAVVAQLQQNPPKSTVSFDENFDLGSCGSPFGCGL